MSGLASYRFLSYVRAGMAGLMSAVDNLGAGAPIPAVASVEIGVPVAGADYADDSQPKPDTVATNTVNLNGPGDIVGINPRQVIRTFPRDRSTSAETTMFALIEFDRPDLPWMFTPAHATPDGRVRPWLCLVVVERTAGVSFGPRPGQPLPVLTIAAPANPAHELPDPADAWLWAHAQVVGGSEPVGSVLDHPSALTLARLIAPRNLQPDTAYLACVVPTFEVGRKAGLGETVAPADEAALLPAWLPTATSVALPVYYSFEFSTAVGGDFESLAELLVPRTAPDTLGHQPLDVTNPGSGLPVIAPADPATPGAIYDLAGALCAPGYVPPTWPESARKPYADKLTADLNASYALAQPTAAAPAGELTVGPPLYGQWHAAKPQIDGSEPQWMRELNLDPGNRVAASLAGAVVELDAEDLMASAWQQIGAVDAANRALRAAQLGREIAQRIYNRHVLPLVENAALHATAPVHGRVLADPTKTVSAAVAASALPSAAASTSMRRMLRNTGPLAHSWRVAAITTATLLDRLASGDILASSAVRTPDGAVTLSPPLPVLGETLAAAVAAKLGTATAGSGGLSLHLNEQNAVLNAAPDIAQRAVAVSTAPPSAFELSAVATEFVTRDKIAATSIIARAASQTFQQTRADIGHVGAAGVGAGNSGGADLGGAAGLGLAERRTPAGAPVEKFIPVEKGVPVERIPVGQKVPVVVTADSFDAALIRSATVAYAARIVVAADAPPRPLAPALPEGSIRSALAAGLTPQTTLLARMNGRLNIDLSVRAGFGAVPVRDPLAGIMAAPVFTRPMYEALRDHYQDFLVPGLADILPNTITLVETNPRFVEAFMVGLNHDMARKLLWREYPTDQRGTYFKRFWGDIDDIGPIPAFSTNTALGADVAGGAQPHIVLLVRGELLRRYPNAIVYAVLATGGPNAPAFDETTIVLPSFRGSLAPDFTFIGFPLTIDAVRAGNPNPNPALSEDYWFVIAEHPTEPRFGLHAPDWTKPRAVPASTDDLTWALVARTPADLAALGYAPTTPLAPLAGATFTAQNVRYAQDAGAQAYLTYRNPVRVAMHADDVLAAIAATPAPGPVPHA
jgi:hypothetical protein